MLWWIKLCVCVFIAINLYRTHLVVNMSSQCEINIRKRPNRLYTKIKKPTAIIKHIIMHASYKYVQPNGRHDMQRSIFHSSDPDLCPFHFKLLCQLLLTSVTSPLTFNVARFSIVKVYTGRTDVRSVTRNAARPPRGGPHKNCECIVSTACSIHSYTLIRSVQLQSIIQSMGKEAQHIVTCITDRQSCI